MPPDVAERDPDLARVEDHLVAREQIVGPRDQHVEGQQGQDQVRPRQPPPAAEPRAGPSQVSEQPRDGVATLHDVNTASATNANPTTRCGHPSVINVTVASEAAKAASRPRWTGEAGTHPAALGHSHRPVIGEGVPLVTGPASLRTVTAAYSIGRVAMPVGSRPASTQPTSMATTGMAITMRNRLLQGT